MRRSRKLTGPDSAIARKPAMKIHVSGRRSRKIRYSASTTATTVITTRTIARTLSQGGSTGAAAEGALTLGGFAVRAEGPLHRPEQLRAQAHDADEARPGVGPDHGPD